MKYTGQRGGSFNTRFREHLRDFKNGYGKSRFAQHLLENKHAIGPMSGIMDTIHFKTRKTNGRNRKFLYFSRNEAGESDKRQTYSKAKHHLRDHSTGKPPERDTWHLQPTTIDPLSVWRECYVDTKHSSLHCTPKVNHPHSLDHFRPDPPSYKETPLRTQGKTGSHPVKFLHQFCK